MRKLGVPVFLFCSFLQAVPIAYAATTAHKVQLKAVPLPMNSVRLTGGPLKKAEDLDAQYLLELEPARMLAYLRRSAGLEMNAQGYGGWDGGGS